MRALIAPLFLSPKPRQPVQVKSFLYRAIVAVVSGLWFSFLPMYFSILYMAERKFFSYEFLTDDVFGMKTLVISGVALLFVVSLYLFGFLPLFRIALSEGRKSGAFGSSRWLTWGAIVVAALMHLLLFYGAVSASKPKLYFGTSAFAFIVCAYMSSFIGGSLREKLSNWFPTAVFVGFTAFFPFVHKDVTADLVEIALRQFRVGGGIPVKVRIFESQEIAVDGRLLLMTPKNLYITEPNGKGKTLIIIRNTDQIRVDIENG